MHIGLLTSGGDSPGMNACIRAVVRTALQEKIKVSGIYYGYEGLIENQIESFNEKSVANIIQRGGTILKTARSARFFDAEHRAIAAKNLKNRGIDTMVVIGGDGTAKGADVFSKEHGIKIIGTPGTIDNDMFGTDYTIGFDTAVNTVIEAIDKIRDTAESHDRVFIVEVMGRDSGQIGLNCALAAGAEAVLIPESRHDTSHLIDVLSGGRNNKSSKIVIVSEGDEGGGAIKLSEKVKGYFPDLDVRVTILGHTQRGGNPSFIDRKYASVLGYEAVKKLQQGISGVMLGFLNKQLTMTPFEKIAKHNYVDIDYLYNITSTLAK